MSKQRYINTHFWDDSYIIDLDPIEKLLFVYLLTNPCTDIAGAYEISIKRISFDTGLDKEMVLKILKRFEDAGKITYRDGWILIHNFVKNQNLNPSVKEGVIRSLNRCPDWIRDRLSQPGGTLPESVLLNLTKPNLTKPKDGEGGSDDSSSSEDTTVATTRGVPVNADADAKLDDWLAAVATNLGVRNPVSLAGYRSWENVCMRAIGEGYELTNFIAAVNAERDRTKDKPQFFSPEGVLKIMQSKPKAPQQSPVKGATAREINARLREKEAKLNQ